jgi:predicted Zn-dependent protease
VNFRSARTSVLPVVVLLVGTHGAAAQGPHDGTLLQRARQEYSTGQYALAERDFREAAKRDPSDAYVQFYLGQSLFQEKKYADSIVPYERARDLEKGGSGFTLTQHRILTDQLAMAYGISGDLKRAVGLLQDAIRDDPEYPLNYYNLACAYAEQGNKRNVLTNLSLAFQHKGHVLKGEQMPDPRTDPSFQKYARDADFIKLMAKLGYK